MEFPKGQPSSLFNIYMVPLAQILEYYKLLTTKPKKKAKVIVFSPQKQSLEVSPHLYSMSLKTTNPE